MAQIGQQLLQPESGWRRYDDTDSNISYIGDWIHTNYASYYKTTASYVQTNGELRFNFTGDKIRIIGQSNSTSNDYSENVKIIIDNVIYILNGKIGSGTQILQFEKQNLRYKEHHIKIINTENKEYDFDAIDIDKNGELKPYNPNLYKYLIKQNNNHYTIKSEFYKNGNYESITELDGKEILNQTDFQAYGIDNLNSLTKIIDTQIVSGIDKGALDNGKLFEFSLNNEIEKIKLQPICKEVNVTDEVIKDKSFLKWYSAWGSATIDLPENYYSKISCVFHGDGTSGNQTGYNATFYYSDGTTDKVLNKYKKCYKIIFSLTFTSFISFDIYKIFQLRYLIQYNNAIYTFNEESIISSPSQELDENNFINNGFIDATAIGKGQWNIAFPDKSNLKLLMWTDDMSKTDVNIDTEIIPFRPIDKLKKNRDICNILFKEV
ncbi:hypothetical protein [Clostridium botulinum]|uniref:hypothetical protein n=1 Tax=Clostridium botulinum TaxID=1491 RepID=UPI003DA58868